MEEETQIWPRELSADAQDHLTHPEGVSDMSTLGIVLMDIYSELNLSVGLGASRWAGVMEGF